MHPVTLLRRVVLLSVGLAALASPQLARADVNVRVMNADGGIYWRSAPDWGTPVAQPGNGVYTGTTVAVRCYKAGTTMPGSNNTMWEYATVVGGPGHGSGWVNSHLLDDGVAINQPTPGIPACDAAPVAVATPAPAGASAPGYPTALVEINVAARTAPLLGRTVWGYTLPNRSRGRQVAPVECYFDGDSAAGNYRSRRWMKVLVWENADGYEHPRWLFVHSSYVYNQPRVRRCTQTQTGYW